MACLKVKIVHHKITMETKYFSDLQIQCLLQKCGSKLLLRFIGVIFNLRKINGNYLFSRLKGAILHHKILTQSDYFSVLYNKASYLPQACLSGLLLFQNVSTELPETV